MFCGPVSASATLKEHDQKDGSRMLVGVDNRHSWTSSIAQFRILDAKQIVAPRVEVDVEAERPCGGEAEADDERAADHP